MLRRVLCFLIFALLVLGPVVGLAASSPRNAKAAPLAKTAVRPAVLGAETTPAATQITQVRWATHTDAVTGESKLRLVFDASGPVTVQRTVVDTPTPRLVVSVQGAVPGPIDNSIDLDGKIADSIDIIADGQNTTITVQMPLMGDNDDYKVFTMPKDVTANKPFRVVVDINKPVPPVVFNYTPGLANKTIVIDPGHGGSDVGAVGPARTTEKAVNLAVAQKVKTLLERAGAKVIMTRQGDSDVYGPNASAVNELKARVTIANIRKADLFLSIHSDSFKSPGVGGSTTYYYRKSSYDALLARCLQASVAQTSGIQDRGILPANFYVIKRTTMPAALVELAFISNPNEEKLLNNALFQQKMAQGIVQGIDNFFDQAANGGGDR